MRVQADIISEIEELRLQQVHQENETAATSEQAQALMNLNIKLQSSASKAQAKTIEMELRKLETAQLAEQSRIITVSRSGFVVQIFAYFPDIPP